jgi:hypothetical protein
MIPILAFDNMQLFVALVSGKSTKIIFDIHNRLQKSREMNVKIT